MKSLHISELQVLAANVQRAHWFASRINNTHEALGDLYATAIQQLDALAETAIGHYGWTDLERVSAVLETLPLAQLVTEGEEIIANLRAELTAPDEGGLRNLVDDLANTFDRMGRYKLELLPAANRT